MRTGYFTVLGDLQSYVDLASIWTSQVCSLAAFSSGVHLGKKSQKEKKQLLRLHWHADFWMAMLTQLETNLVYRAVKCHALLNTWKATTATPWSEMQNRSISSCKKMFFPSVAWQKYCWDSSIIWCVVFPNQLAVSSLTRESLLRNPVLKVATTASSLGASGMVSLLWSTDTQSGVSWAKSGEMSKGWELSCAWNNLGGLWRARTEA